MGGELKACCSVSNISLWEVAFLKVIKPQRQRQRECYQTKGLISIMYFSAKQQREKTSSTDFGELGLLALFLRSSLSLLKHSTVHAGQ